MSSNLGGRSVSPIPYRRDPLRSERALVFKGTHYDDGGDVTRERIDQVVAKMKRDGQIPETTTVNTDLARRSFVAGLKPIYEPFHRHVLHHIHGGKVPLGDYRGGIDPDDPVYHGLHEYLMEHHITLEDVENYIKLHKEDPETADEYEQRRNYDFFDKYGSFGYDGEHVHNPFTRPLGDRDGY